MKMFTACVANGLKTSPAREIPGDVMLLTLLQLGELIN